MNYKTLLLLTIVFFCSSFKNKETESGETKKFLPNWESLGEHQAMPEWLYDAKIGMYFHWGVYTVPEKYSEWYPRNMYVKDHPAFKHHKNTYGDQSEFGYHHFVPMFTAPEFNAEEWASLIKEAGAKFGGTCAEHHDGFSMWNSKVNPWNAKAMGPQKDIVGELKKEITNQGLKFFASFHHSRQLQRNADEPDSPQYDSHFIYNKDWHTSSTDPKLRLLYGNMSEKEFNEFWLTKLEEVIEGYSPDLIYFDSWLNLIPETYRKKFCAGYLNHAYKNGQQPGIIYKQHDLPKSLGINDIEKGGHMEVFYPAWMTDDTMCYGSWAYTTDNSKIKPTSMVLHSLIDIVSKNGVLLLNGSPRADGSIPDEQKNLMWELGVWLKTNGEAIYSTRPWLVHGGGPTGSSSNPHGGMSTTNTYTADDYRFTQSKDGKTLYLTLLGKPEAGKRIKLRELAPHRYPTATPIKNVVELVSGVEAKLEKTDQNYYLTVPDVEMNDMAVVFKFNLE